MRPPRRMAGPRTAAAGTSGISDSGGVAHGPGRRPLVWGGVMHALPRRRGADGLRGEALGPRYSPPSRLRRRSAASRDGRPSRSSHAAYFALMRAGSVLPGSLTSEWRDSNPRPRGPQPRALPTAPHSETVAILPRSRSPDGPKGGWRRRTPAGTRTRIDGFGDRRACHCTTDAKGGVHDAARLAARSSGRQARGRLPRAPSRIRTGDLPLTRRLRYHWAIGALTVPPIAFSNA